MLGRLSKCRREADLSADFQTSRDDNSGVFERADQQLHDFR